MKRLVAILLAAAVLVADLVTKSQVFAYLRSRGYPLGQDHWLAGRWFALTRVWNPGVTGGMGAGLHPWVITAFTIVAIVLVALYLLVPKHQSLWVVLGLGSILGGALGNLYDRLRFGEVRDFIDVWPRLSWPSWLHHWPTFNLADSAIVIGVGLLVFHSLFLGKKTAKSDAGVESTKREA